jgi:hypothetical protein
MQSLNQLGSRHEACCAARISLRGELTFNGARCRADQLRLPNIIVHRADGTRIGMSDAASPWSGAVARG